MRLPPDDRDQANRTWRRTRNMGVFVALVMAAIAAPSALEVATGHSTSEAREMLSTGFMLLGGLATVVGIAIVITHWTAWRRE